MLNHASSEVKKGKRKKGIISRYCRAGIFNYCTRMLCSLSMGNVIRPHETKLKSASEKRYQHILMVHEENSCSAPFNHFQLNVEKVDQLLRMWREVRTQTTLLISFSCRHKCRLYFNLHSHPIPALFLLVFCFYMETLFKPFSLHFILVVDQHIIHDGS